MKRLNYRALLLSVMALVLLSTGVATAGPISMLDPDLVLWLDANQITGKSNGDRVDLWEDLSPVGTNDATPKFVGTTNSYPVYSNAGIGGLPTVRFEGTATDGVNDILVTPNSFNSTPYTIFTVSRLTGGQNFRVISSNSKNWLLGYWGTFEDRMFAEGWVLQGPNAATTTPQIHTGIGNGIGTSFLRDGLLLANNNGGVQAPGALSLGGWGSGAGSEYSRAEVSEVLIYDRVLSAEERNQVGYYLESKYSLTTNFTDPTLAPAKVTVGFPDFAQPVNAPNGDFSAGLLVVHPFEMPDNGYITQVNIANDLDNTSEAIDLLILRPTGGDNYEIIHRVSLPGDDSASWTGVDLMRTYTLPDPLQVEPGDIFAHWALQAPQPVPYRNGALVSPGLSRYHLNVATGLIDEGDSILFSPAGGFSTEARDYLINLTWEPVPEPASASLALVGLGALALRRRRAA